MTSEKRSILVLTLKSNSNENEEKIVVYPKPINDDIPNEQKRRLIKSDLAERGAAE